MTEEIGTVSNFEYQFLKIIGYFSIVGKLVAWTVGGASYK